MQNKVKKVQGNDSFQRINYLYQISKQITQAHPALSSYYGSFISSVAKKNVLKIHPEMKRQICKKCRCVLVEGVSASMKMKSKNNRKFMQWVCKTCGTRKLLPADNGKDHRVWVEKDEAVVEVIS